MKSTLKQGVDSIHEGYELMLASSSAMMNHEKV